VLADRSLQGCAGISNAPVAIATQDGRRAEALTGKKKSDF
jgi:hypothetical protein